MTSVRQATSIGKQPYGERTVKAPRLLPRTGLTTRDMYSEESESGIAGTCMQMCSEKEALMRQERRELSVFELVCVHNLCFLIVAVHPIHSAKINC